MRPLMIGLVVVAVSLLGPVHISPDQHRPMIEPSRRTGAERVLVVTATAYTNSPADTGKSPGDPGYGITKTGTVAKVGTVAVDPRVIPLGSRLWIEGYGMAVAEDTGKKIKGARVDVFFNDKRSCREWGRRQVEARIIDQ